MFFFQVYCNSHVPKSGPGHLDQTSVGIRQALNVPKTNKYVNEQIRGIRDVESESDPQQYIYINIRFLIMNGNFQAYNKHLVPAIVAGMPAHR